MQALYLNLVAFVAGLQQSGTDQQEHCTSILPLGRVKQHVQLASLQHGTTCTSLHWCNRLAFRAGLEALLAGLELSGTDQQAHHTSALPPDQVEQRVQPPVVCNTGLVFRAGGGLVASGGDAVSRRRPAEALHSYTAC